MTARRKDALALDARAYGRLLAKALPRAIVNDEQNEAATRELEVLLDKGDRRTAEEAEMVRLLVALIEHYEHRTYPMPKSPPHEVLRALMEAHGLKQVDLVGVLGSPGHISSILAGDKPISRKGAVALAKRFRIGADVFLSDEG